MRMSFKITRRTLLPIASLVMVWVCFYLVLLASDVQKGAPRAIISSSPGQSVEVGVVYPALTESDEGTPEPLDRRFERFYVPDLQIARLATILKAGGIGLHLEYPPELRDLAVSAEYAQPVSTAEILQNMVTPRGYGIMRQGNIVRVVKIEVRREKRRTPAKDGEDSRVFMSNKLETALTGRPGEPIDLWVSANPKVTLRLLAQPLHSEFGESALEIGLVVAAFRDDELWFRHQFETRLGQPARFDVRATESMWCQIGPSAAAENEIKLQIELYYESYEDDI